MFRGASIRLMHNPQPSEIKALLTRLKADGVNAVAIIPHHYVYLAPGTATLVAPPKSYRIPWYIHPDIGQDVGHPFQNTPSPDTVYYACLEAEAMGFTVMLKPHIDSYQGAWRGYISVAGHANNFRSSYREAFLRRYVVIAKALNDPILCMGCELYTVTKELGYKFWEETANWIRSSMGAGYGGRLTYAANWGVGPDAEYNRLARLWPTLDYVGIDGYFPLVPQGAPPSPSYDDLLSGWDTPLGLNGWEPKPAVDCLDISRASNKPFLFTEIGISNYTTAARVPGEDPPPDAVRDDNLQLNYYRAFRNRFDNEPSYAGYFAWEAWLGTQQPISHSVIGKPAEAIAFR